MIDTEWKSDLLISWMNLIEKENHSRFNWMITNDEFWLEELALARKERLEITNELELKMEDVGQGHCDNKHDSSIIFRNIEVGDKFIGNGDKENAKKYYERAFKRLGRFIIRNKLNENTEENISFFNKIKNSLKS